MPEGIEARLQELDRRLRDGRFEGLRQFLAKDYFGYSPGPGEPAASDRITDLVMDLKAALPDLTAAFDNIAVDADGNATAGQGDLKDLVSATGNERCDVCKDEECHGDLQQDPSDGVGHGTGSWFERCLTDRA